MREAAHRKGAAFFVAGFSLGLAVASDVGGVTPVPVPFPALLLVLTMSLVAVSLSSVDVHRDFGAVAAFAVRNIQTPT
ncbi:hypothetical protein ACFFGH_04090 [Lysobacter korlensis]|uniref:Uncharacterized protein n=1 Tax=Lysobacter korlensis TaxID=553636 RepID=A0ABV6RKC6_9GAMM